MKRLILILICIIIFTGCDKTEKDMNRAIAFRQRLLQQKGCSFECNLIADYGDVLYQFSLACEAENDGNVSFSVSAPESISGITGTISNAGAKITFDDTVLGFPILSENLPTPLSGPYIFISGLRSGYIRACNIENERMTLAIADTYEDDSIVMNIRFDQQEKPVSCEFVWKGRRILSMQINSFNYM